MSKTLIGLGILGFFAWFFGRAKSKVVFDPDPAASARAPDSYLYWTAMDDQAIREFSTANRDRMLAPPNSRAATEAQSRYDKAFALHKEYAAKAQAAYNRERGIR